MNTALRPSGWTLRTKLVSSVLALSIVVIFGIGALVVWELQRTLHNKVDTQLTTSAQQIKNGPPDSAALANQGNGSGDSLQVDMSGGQIICSDPTGSYIFPNCNQGQRRANIYRLGERPIRLTDRQVQLMLNTHLSMRPSTVTLHKTVQYRVVEVQHSVPLVNQQPIEVTTIIGLPLRDNKDTVQRAALAVILLSVAGLILVGLGSAYLVRRNLEPLRRVAATATRVSTLPLSTGEVVMQERVAPSDTDERTEVGQVGAALNQMLDHVTGALTARQESETRVRQFVADASHELRTPLASIRGYAELSRREHEPVPEGVQHAMSRIESESTRMTALVEDLLLLARLDSGRPLEREPVDVTLLVMETTSDARAAGPDHRWALDLPEEPAEMIGDEARIRQVLINVLANARRHTPPGTLITTRVGDTRYETVIRVTDNGPGIPPELLPHIFERFIRGDSARTRTEGSTGLGLAIVSAVVSAHGGRLEVASQPGETSFTIYLPRAAAVPT
ncbi:MAG: ATP-binding protein [Actinomycetota bacterium]|nr:ATP-binding protein [Actinomycetota bacterium]